MPISTSSRSASTGANRAAGASCSTGFSNRLLPSSRFPTNPWSSVPQTRISETTRCWGHGSQINTHLVEFMATPLDYPRERGRDRRGYQKYETEGRYSLECPQYGPPARGQLSGGTTNLE